MTTGTEANANENSTDILSENLWPGFDKFKDVQVLLDRNKFLIHEINSNHEKGYPSGVDKVVGLLRELNLNVAKAQELYEEAGSGFSVGLNTHMTNRPSTNASGETQEQEP